MNCFCFKNVEIQTKCGCLWQQIEGRFQDWMTNFNYDQFWCDITQFSEIKKQPFFNLTSVYKDGRGQFELEIGYDLSRTFAFVAIFWDHLTKKKVEMNYKQLRKFLTLSSELIKIDTSYPGMSSKFPFWFSYNENKGNDDVNDVILRMSQHVNHVFNIYINNHIFQIYEQCLLEIMDLEPFILPLIDSVMQNESFMKQCFFKVLYKESQNTINTINICSKKEKLTCDCMSKNIFEELQHIRNTTKLHQCMKLFKKISFYDEENRVKSFEFNWPLNYIQPKVLAKFGFFYTGENDKVQCAFCDIIQWKWLKSDNVLEEHLHFASNCPLLRGKAKQNIPSDFETLQRDLSTIVSGYDTVN